jgi:hypothetical protein
MRDFRNIVFLVILGGLIIFTLQNLQPSLSLTFLGLKTVPLPLSLYVVGAIALGFTTAWMMWALFSLSNPSVQRRGTRRSRPPEWSEEPDLPRSPASSRDRRDRVEARVNPSGAQTYIQTDADNRLGRGREDEATHLQDLEGEPEENWIDEDDRAIASPSKEYEVERPPTRQSWSGSIYSYTYREGDRPPASPTSRATSGETEEESEEPWENWEGEEGTQDRESDESESVNPTTATDSGDRVYDAPYRVTTPPSQTESNNEDNADEDNADAEEIETPQDWENDWKTPKKKTEW